MRRARPGGVQLEIVANLLVLALAGLAVVAVVMGSLAARQVEDAAVARLRLGARQLERVPGAGVRSLVDIAALAQTRSPATLGGEFGVADDRGFRVGLGPRTRIDAPELRALMDLARLEGEAGRSGGVLGGDVQLVVRIHPPDGAPGFLLGRVPREELLAELMPMVHAGIWVLSIATLVFVGFGSYLLRRRISLPLRGLATATARAATGDLDVRADVSGPAELTELGESFNRMAESLARQRDALVSAHESLSRSQRLATVGQLAAGVAHEVGNPVAAILGYTEVILRDPALSERSRETTDRVHAEALRIRTLVRELLDLGRTRSAELTLASPHALLSRVAERMRAQKRLDHVDLVVDTQDDLPDVEVDRGRFEQILINLVENAALALRDPPPDGEDALVELRASRARQDLPSRRREDRGDASYVHRRRDDAVAFEVIDNGPGIPPDVLDQIFDPFFTTRDPGEGTGLGLWNAQRIAEMLGGSLDATSECGRTCFRLILPCADTPEQNGRSQDPDHR